MSRDKSPLMLPPPRPASLLLLYSCDTRAGQTRDGVPELMSKDAREEAARGECDCERRGRQEDRKEDVFLREH